jgi:RHS repeat-associated protein
VQEAVDTYDSRRQFQYAYGINDGVNPVQETSGATILANILPGRDIDEFITRTDVIAGTISNFLTDALGSPVAVTDNAGVVQTEYTYESFGRTTVNGAPNNSAYQYTGRENDGTGLYYYRARFYHPALQRFLSEDPIEFEGGNTNLYSYVFNNPTNHTDAWGLRAIPTPIGPLPLPFPITQPIPWTPANQRAMEDFFRDLLDKLTSPGNVVDTQVKEDYERYVEQERACKRKPLNRCDWLKQNRGNYRIDQWKPTEKAWGCRGH